MKKIYFILLTMFFVNISFARNDLTIDIDGTANKKNSIVFENIKIINTDDDFNTFLAILGL